MPTTALSQRNYGRNIIKETSEKKLSPDYALTISQHGKQADEPQLQSNLLTRQGIIHSYLFYP